ncbi:MAG: hypothetical protein J6J43_01195 [Oscillospiraceae bacterium]|nr:hypothetical protein [Oscillospiraceae bacterium]
MKNVLKQIEDLLDKVNVSGEENWRRMSNAKEALRELRRALEKAEAEQQKKEAEENAAGNDAAGKRQQKGHTGTV